MTGRGDAPKATMLELKPFLTAPERSVVRAVVDAIVGEGDEARDADVVDYTTAYAEAIFADIPPDMRLPLRALLVGLGLFGPLLVLGVPMPFTMLSHARRAALVERLEGHGSFMMRALAQTLKSMVTLGYFTHPAVRERLELPVMVEGRWQDDRFSTRGLPPPRALRSQEVG